MSRFRIPHHRVLIAVALVALITAPLAAQAVPAKPVVPVAVAPSPVESAAAAVAPEAVPQESCQPDPLEPRLQLLRCRYGPIVVTPGSNLILFGPVTIEQPRAEGFMLSMKPNMVDAVTGQVPEIHEVHLHHGVWLEAGKGFGAIDIPFMAAGEEKTVSRPPLRFVDDAVGYEGYGYRVNVGDQWLLNYMIHNQTAATYETFITYDLEWLNAASPLASRVLPVKPVWWDTVGGFYPVYDPARTPGATTHVRPDNFGVEEDMEIVWLAGHVHPGGKQIEIKADRCAGSTANRGAPIFTSIAKPNDRGPNNGFGSWDYLMTATKPDFRYTMHRGDTVQFDTVYDTTNPWYEAMGIVFGWGIPLDSLPAGYAAAPRCALPAAELTTGVVTNVVPPMPVFGGDQVLFDDPAGADVSDQEPVAAIDIAAFNYFPGGTASPPAPVAAGSRVVVTNLDAGASVYHSITSCADACNKNSGQSYPLAAWSFDSKQLGYGVPGVTAARQSLRWNWDIPAGTPVGTTIPYFCRVHPFMRGSVQVVR